jgi:hypothetical protein
VLAFRLTAENSYRSLLDTRFVHAAPLGRTEECLNRDPIGEWGGWNLYMFVRNQSTTLVDRDGLDVYDLRRSAHLCGGLFDHSFVFIDGTGERDAKGRPVNYVVDLNDKGQTARPTPLPLDDYLKSGKKRDPDLRVCKVTKTTPAEAGQLRDFFKDDSPKQNYSFFFNNCRETYPRANGFLGSIRDPKPPLPNLFFP